MWTGGRGAWTRTQIADGSLRPGWSGIPTDLADTGTIVGFDFLLGNRFAWILPEGQGPILDLKTYIQAHGGVVPTNLQLQVCQAVSKDGRYIVGHGFFTGAWLVTIIPDCPSDLNRDGVVDLADLTQLLSAFGACAEEPGFNAEADIDADLCVSLADLTLLLSAFGASCP